MSVGLQRLREDAETDPPGRDRQGRGPGARRSGARARRPPPGAARRGRRAEGRAERGAASRIGEAIKGGAEPDGAEVADAQGGLDRRPGAQIEAIDAELATVEAEVERAAAAHPEPGRPRRAGRRRGGQRHGPDVGRAAAGRAAGRRRGRGGRARRRRDLAAPAALGDRRPTLDIIDNPRGAKVAGSGFPVYKGAGSALQRALIDWFLDVHTRENGMTEIWPPAVVNTASATGTGQIPDKEDQMYVVTRDDLYLVPTAEVPVTNLHRDEILEADRAADPLRRLLAVLPARGRRGRQGHPRHPARPPVRQGRDGLLREAGRLAGRARVADRAGRDPPPAARPRRIASC